MEVLFDKWVFYLSLNHAQIEFRLFGYFRRRYRSLRARHLTASECHPAKRGLNYVHCDRPVVARPANGSTLGMGCMVNARLRLHWICSCAIPTRRVSQG